MRDSSIRSLTALLSKSVGSLRQYMRRTWICLRRKTFSPSKALTARLQLTLRGSKFLQFSILQLQCYYSRSCSNRSSATTKDIETEGGVGKPFNLKGQRRPHMGRADAATHDGPGKAYRKKWPDDHWWIAVAGGDAMTPLNQKFLNRTSQHFCARARRGVKRVLPRAPVSVQLRSR